MKLHIRNTFPCDPDALWDVFASPEFEQRLEAISGVRVEPIEEVREDGGVEFRRLRCESKKELPRVVAKAIGSRHLVYEQVSRLDRAANQLKWQVIPTMLSDRVTAEGTTTVRATATGSERVIDGDIVVRVPLVGGKIEKIIVSSVQESYEGAARVANELLRERG